MLWFHSKAAIWISARSIYTHIYQSRFIGYPDVLLNLHPNLSRYSRWSPTRVISTPANISMFPISSKMSFGLLNYWYDIWYYVWNDIFIYCKWVSTRWQWSVELYNNRKETEQKEKQYTKQYKNTEYTKKKTKVQEKQIKRILRNVSRAIRKWQREANNNDITYHTEPTYRYITISQW